MRKIALVTGALHIGGTETVIMGLARGLRNAGKEPSFVITDAIGAWHTKPLREGFAVHTVLQSSWQNRFQHVRAVAECLRHFDVILLNFSKSAQCSLGLLPETTVVISIVHNDNAAWYSVALSNRGNLDAVVAVSEHVRREVLLRGIPDAQTRFIRNGTEIYAEFPKKLNSFTPEDPLRIVFVGRVDHSQKGVFYLPGILAGLTSRGIYAHLDIIGCGPDLEPLRDRIDALAMTSRCSFHGGLNHEEAMAILRTADVLILPSHYEGQGVVIFEAMARGVVPIVSHLKDVTDCVIKDGEDGFLVAVGDEDGFVRALASLATDRGRLAAMAHVAWQSSRKFSNDEMTSQYLRLINECHEKRSHGKTPGRTGTIDRHLLGQYPALPRAIAGIGYSIVRRMGLNRAG